MSTHAAPRAARPATAMLRSLVVVIACVAIASGVAWPLSQHGATFHGAPVAALCFGLAFALQWVAFVPAFAAQTERFYDLTGTATYLSVTWLAVWASGATNPRSVIVAAFVTVWSLRLGSFLFLRIKRDGKDGRFDEIKRSGPRFLVAWTLQGLWVALTLAAALAAITNSSPAPLGVVDVIGAAIWMFGFAIEVIADRQKRAFRAAHPGRFIDTGLWAWSRHPNYFGEIVLWAGIAVMAASTLRGGQWVGLISPIFVALLLTKVSGVPLLEKRADERWGGQDDYEAYKAATPVLWPRPPRGDR